MPDSPATTPADRPTIAAVLLPAERLKVEAAGHGCFTLLLRDSVPEAVRAVRERPVDGILLSVHRCPPNAVQEVRRLVHDFPGIPTVALVSTHDAASSETLLQLGATGLRQVVDVTGPTGWQRLRQLMAAPVTRAAARIQGPLVVALGEPPADLRFFFEMLVRLAPDITTVRALCRACEVRPSTLMSRFSRAGLPSPKSYLASVRLLHAAHLLEAPGRSIADVAYRLEYSSPQSFGRHVRAMLGITSLEFRRRFPFPAALARFLELMILPYGGVWPVFHPLETGSWDSGHCLAVQAPPPH
ncbi:MAG TPA: helix-turn-helix transcriptional regulator [Gemmatimonadales bacterium]|nr:helix-turn-helix transcriptional regulator [Gemmatimonadales bacterium]HRZ09037.1 helix-turn-helix transcriptional regulator [Gemmatimonadales bacterium]